MPRGDPYIYQRIFGKLIYGNAEVGTTVVIAVARDSFYEVAVRGHTYGFPCLLACGNAEERMINFLESLVAEWYQYGKEPPYFVRSNTRVRKRKKGGYDGEIDVLAYSPSEQHLIHIEASSDGDSWEKRKERFLKKFILKKDEYESLIRSPVKSIEKIALVGWTERTRVDLNWGEGIKVQLISDLVRTIATRLKKISPLQEVVPECFPLLRAMQVALHFGGK